MKVFAKLRREVLVALSKMGLKRATVYRGSKKFRIPLFHGIGRFLFLDHEPWRRKTLRAIAKMDPKVILDVGVNVGQTLLDVKEVMPEVKYVGFEPNSSCVFYVNELIRLNRFRESYVLPLGLDTESRMRVLHSSKWDDASSTLLAQEKSQFNTTIYTERGDDFLEKENVGPVSFVKIDTEGYEFHVLKGLERMLKKSKPVVFCEVFSHSESNRELYEFLQKIGYEVFECGDNLSLKVMDQENLFTNPCHDYIFAPQNKLQEFERHFT